MNAALSISNRHDNVEDWLTAREAASLLNCSERHACRIAQAQLYTGKGRLAPPREGKGKPVWWVHRSIDSRLSRVDSPDTRESKVRDSLLSKFARHHVERAYRKSHWMHEWRRRCSGLHQSDVDVLTFRRVDVSRKTERDHAGDVALEARAAEGDGFKISTRALQIWWSAYNELGLDGQIRGVEALVDRYQSSDDGDGDDPLCSRDSQAVDYFYSLYRTEIRLGVKQCHAMTLLHCRQTKLAWPASVSATRRWIAKYDDLSLSYLCREGKKAWTKKFMPYNEQEWELVPPGSFYVADHHQCDFWVEYKGRQLRPWLTAIQDCGSRRIVGWHLGPAPHQEAILSALNMAFHEAVPGTMRIDNGRDFKSKALTGLTRAERKMLHRQFIEEHGKDAPREWRTLLRRDSGLLSCGDDARWHGIAEELGIKLIFSIPYHAWSKGTLERWFGTFERQCGKSFATYCGHNPEHRPEGLQLVREGFTGRGQDKMQIRDGAAIPSLDEAAARIGDYLEVYHAAPHSGRGMDGVSPKARWSQATALRKADDAALDFLISIRGAYRVGANGVALSIGQKRMSYGARSAALRAWVGRDVLVGVDPNFPARCLAWDPESRRLIAALEPNVALHPDASTDDLREASAAIGRERKMAGNHERNSARRILTAEQRVAMQLREQAVAARATGTDNARPNISPVRTGFEGVSKPVQTYVSVASREDEDFSELCGDTEFEPHATDDHEFDAELLSIETPSNNETDIDDFL